MRFPWNLLFVCLFAFLVSYRGYSSRLSTLTMVLVDDFAEQNAWTLKFSKFRSKTWHDSVGKPYEESNSWLKIIDANQYKDENILPLGVHNTALFPNPGSSVLAIRGRWDFPRHNWLALEPSALRASMGDKGRILELLAFQGSMIPKSGVWSEGVDPNFVWLPWKVREVSFFLWGSNTSHSVELHFLDYRGKLHVLQAGDLKFKGWKLVSVRIPNRVPQVNEYGINRVQPLRFVRFKILADPEEKTKYFHTYIAHFYAGIQVEEDMFPGYPLGYAESYWTASTSPTNQKPQ